VQQPFVNLIAAIYWPQHFPEKSRPSSYPISCFWPLCIVAQGLVDNFRVNDGKEYLTLFFTMYNMLGWLAMH
jgi:hypothetical protein